MQNPSYPPFAKGRREKFLVSKRGPGLFPAALTIITKGEGNFFLLNISTIMKLLIRLCQLRRVFQWGTSSNLTKAGCIIYDFFSHVGGHHCIFRI